MADENPTDVEAPVTGTKEDAVEPGAEDIDKPPKGAAVSEDEVVEKVAEASADKAPAEEPEAPKKKATKKPKKEPSKKPKKKAAEEPKKKATKKPKKEVAEGPEKKAVEEPKKKTAAKKPKKAAAKKPSVAPEEQAEPEKLPPVEASPLLAEAEKVKALPEPKKEVAEGPAPATTEPAADAPVPVKAEAADGVKPKEEKKAKGKAKAPAAEPKAGPEEEKETEGKAKAPAAEPKAEPKEPERTFADELREEYGDIETATLDILPDLERKRDRLNGLAEEHKFKRDRLNGVTKQLAEERDSYNAQVRELVQAANEHRNNRNLLNTEVKDAKVIRDELNRKATEYNEVVTKLKRERQGETGGPSLNRMRNERKALEFKAMTQVLSADKEKELMVQIQRLNIQIDDQEKKMEESREVRTALKDSRQSKEEAEAQHRLVSDLARQAQTAHDTMIELYEKADDIRKKADDCQGRFIANKQLADAEHKAHIDLIRKVHDYDKFISGLRRRDRRARKDRQEKAQKQVAEDMMDRFKKGEKLSTEDLLSLQTERF
jgi:uncharacterized coiled-coil DUF342 family protein